MTRPHAVARHLLPWIGLLIIIVNVTLIARLQADINTLAKSSHTQQREIESLKSDLSSLHAKDGTALQRCLDSANRKYGNAIDSQGTPSRLDGAHSQTLTLDQYNAINNQLTEDRKKCNELYKS